MWNNESDSGRRNITESDKGCVVTIGNFDGVHLGHQAILAAVKSQATKDGVDSMLVCFEPQPKEFFDEFKAPARLTRFAEKVECLSQHGVDRILCMKFNERPGRCRVKLFSSWQTSSRPRRFL